MSEEDADWLYVSFLTGNMPMLHKLFQQAKRRDMKICFNPGKKELAIKDKLLGLLSDVDVLTLNKEEMQLCVWRGFEACWKRFLRLVPGRFGDGRRKRLNCKRRKNHRASADV